MSFTLHLGVLDQPYRFQASSRRGKRRSRASTKTTGDIATYLEDKYHVLEHFYELHQKDIAKSLEKSLAGSLETMLMGGPAPAAPSFASAESEIETMMKDMISKQELDSLGYPGIPTLAALRGVNHRMLHPYARRPPRPSFRDTGLYQSSLKAWMD